MSREVSDLTARLNQYSKKDANLWNLLKALVDRVGFDSLSFDGIALPANSRAGSGRLLFDRFHKKFQHSENGRDFVDVQPHERARVYRATDQSIANNTVTAVSFSTVTYDCLDDVDQLFKIATPTRLTARYPGNYSIGAVVRFEASAVGDRALFLQVTNPTGTVEIVASSGPAATIVTQLNVNTDYELGPTDYVEAFVYQDSGGALNILTATMPPTMWIRRNN